MFLECWAYNELAYWLAQFFQRGFSLLGLPEDNHDSPARIFLLIGFEPTVSWENETFPILGSSDSERMSWQKLSFGMEDWGSFGYDFLAYQAMFGCTGNSKTMRQDLKQFYPRFTGSHHLLMILLIQTTGKRKFRLQQKSLKDFCLHQAERRETAMSQFVRDIPLKQIGGAPRR